MKRTGSIGIVNNEILKKRNTNITDQKWFYLNTIKKTSDPNYWDLNYEYFDGENDKKFECIILLTDERIKPKHLVHQRLGSFSKTINNTDWFRKTLISINGQCKTEFLSERVFKIFSWEENQKDLEPLSRNLLPS